MPALKRTSPELDPRYYFYTSMKEGHSQQTLAAERPVSEGEHELTPDMSRKRLQKALGAGALARAEKLEHEKPHSLETQLFKLAGNVHGFFENLQKVQSIRVERQQNRNLDPTTRAEFKAAKRSVAEFNDIVSDVINTGANKISYQELVTFMSSMYEIGGGQYRDAFAKEARSLVDGMRNELGFEQVLIAAGLDYQPADPDADLKGADAFVLDTPIDVKASHYSALNAKRKALQEGRNPDLIIWSHITSDDFEGRLTLPLDKVDQIAEKVKPDIERAVQSYKRHGKYAS